MQIAVQDRAALPAADGANPQMNSTAMTPPTRRPRRWLRATTAGTLCLGLMLGACQNPDGSQAQKTTVGTVGGAAAGGLIGGMLGGGKAGAVAAGALFGALFGGAVGSSLDQKDREIASRTANRTFETAPTGTTTTWNNPDSGHHGTVTPTRTYKDDSGTYCREYQTTVTVGGEEQKAYGTACRQPDGQWKIMS